MPHYLTSGTGRHLRTTGNRRLAVRLQTDPGQQLRCDVAQGSAANVFQFDLADALVLGTPHLLAGTLTQVQARFNAGSWLSLADYNTLVAGTPPTQLALGYRLQLKIQRPAYQAISLTIPVFAL